MPTSIAKQPTWVGFVKRLSLTVDTKVVYDTLRAIHLYVNLQCPSRSTCHLEAPQAAVAAEIPNFFDPNFNFDEWSGSPVCSTPLSGGF